MSAATSMMTLTPRTTPKTVSALRSLCVRRVSIACLRFSPCDCAMESVSSVGTKRFDRVEFRGAHGRINTEEKSDAGGNTERQNHGAHRGLHRNRGRGAAERNDAVCEDDSDHATSGGEHGGFRHELKQDVILARAQRAADADLTRALGDAGKHDVHDHDAAHEEKHR